MPWGLFSTPLGDRAMKQEGAEEKRWAALYRTQKLKVKTELRLLGLNLSSSTCLGTSFLTSCALVS